MLTTNLINICHICGKESEIIYGYLWCGEDEDQKRYDKICQKEFGCDFDCVRVCLACSTEGSLSNIVEAYEKLISREDALKILG